MPLAGRERDGDAHIDEGLQRQDDGERGAGHLREGIARLGRAHQKPHGEHAEQQRDQPAEDEAELLARHGKDEVGMRIRDAGT